MTDTKKLKAAKLYEIISGIPLPAKGQKQLLLSDRFKPMQVGDVIKITQKEMKAVHINGQKLKYKMATRKIGKDAFAWRVE